MKLETLFLICLMFVSFSAAQTGLTLYGKNKRSMKAGSSGVVR